MRRRRVAPALALTAVVAGAATAGAAGAQPRPSPRITINAPGRILDGDGVLIYGRLQPAPARARRLTLYERPSGSRHDYAPIAETTAGADGFYEFRRPEGSLERGASWLVEDGAVDGVDSRTVHTQVAALVTLKASRRAAATDAPIVFSGRVAPGHAGARVLLQQQIGSSDRWRTVERARLGAGSEYTISHAWHDVGAKDMRVLFAGSVRNARSVASPVTVMIEPANLPGFTIDTVAPIVAADKRPVISGALRQPQTSAPEPGVPLALWATNADTPAIPVAETTTDEDGRYRVRPPAPDIAPGFTPAFNTWYQLRTTGLPFRSTVRLLQGMRELVTVQATNRTPAVGETIRLSGTVRPSKFVTPRHVIYLQQRGVDGRWHTVDTGLVRPSRAFGLEYDPSYPGTVALRAWVTDDDRDVGGGSAPVTLTVGPPAGAGERRSPNGRTM